MAETAVFRRETTIIKTTLSAAKIKDFQFKNGILYYAGRLDQANKITIKDIDFDIFIDNSEFQGLLPVVRVDSSLFFSYLMNIHLKIRPHAGIEITVREMMKKMFVLGNFRVESIFVCDIYHV